MNINEAFPSKYLKASDLKGKSVPVHIGHVTTEEVSKGESKLILYFQGKQKGMVLNKTNANNIATIYGPDTDNWAGHEIVLFEAMVDFQGRTVAALRVRGPQPKDRPQSTAKPKPEPSQDRDAIDRDAMDDEIPF